MTKLIVAFRRFGNMPENETHTDFLADPKPKSLYRNLPKNNCPGIKPREKRMKAR
jgi:hypothetical protein